MATITTFPQVRALKPREVKVHPYGAPAAREVARTGFEELCGVGRLRSSQEVMPSLIGELSEEGFPLRSSLGPLPSLLPRQKCGVHAGQPPSGP